MNEVSGARLEKSLPSSAYTTQGAWQAERAALGLSERQVTVYELGAAEAV